MLKSNGNDLTVVDCHVHGGPDFFDWWNRVIKTETDFISYLDKCGVDKALLGAGMKGLKSETAKDLIEANEYITAFCLKHSSKFIPTVHVSAKYPKESVLELKKARKNGIVWVGELCNYIAGYKYNSPEFTELLTAIRELDMILQIHTEEKELEPVLKSFPEITTVLPHPGGGRKEMDYRIGLAEKYSNLYLDLCGYGADRIGNIETMCDKLGPEKVLFGSDFTVNDPSTVTSRIINAMVPEESKAKILGLNTLRLLKEKGAVL